MPAVIRLLLVRHGQSTWNASGRWQGQADPPLSDLGRHQARVAADALGTPDVIVASDLERANHTALILSEALGVGPVVIEPGLRERDAGEWAGLTRDEIEEAWPGYLADRRRPPGFEDEAAIVGRALEAIGRIHAEYDGGQIVAVTHGGVVFALERHLGVEAPGKLPNLAGRQVVVDGDRIRLDDRIVLVDHENLTVPGQI